MPAVSIVIPVRNEAPNIGPLAEAIDRVFPLGTLYQIDFVDDSTDAGETARAIDLAAHRASRGYVSHFPRPISTGLSSAILEGIHRARFPDVIVMDGDGQHPAALLPAILDSLLKGNELVIPSRYAPGAPGFLGPMHRRLISWGARELGRALVPALRRSTDPASGFFGLKKAVIEDVDIHPIGWKTLADILAVGRYVSLDEIPYTFGQRLAGRSHMGPGAHVAYMRQLLALRRASRASARVLAAPSARPRSTAPKTRDGRRGAL